MEDISKKVVDHFRDESMAKEVQNFLKDNGINSWIELREDSYFVLALEEDIPRIIELQRPKNTISKEWMAIRSLPYGKYNLIFSILCAIVFIIYLADPNSFILDKLFITRRVGFLEEFFLGQYWRIISPIFIHFGFMHFFFNMMWMKDLGKIIENHHGPKIYITLIVVLAAISNLGQYLTIGPNFGGVSGVLFGLLGFLWICKVYEPDKNLFIPKHDFILMVIWFLVCFSGVGFFKHIANMAHALGLVSGIIFAIFYNKIWEKDFKKGLMYFLGALVITILSTIIEYYKMNQNFYFKIFL